MQKAEKESGNKTNKRQKKKKKELKMIKSNKQNFRGESNDGMFDSLPSDSKSNEDFVGFEPITLCWFSVTVSQFQISADAAFA